MADRAGSQGGAPAVTRGRTTLTPAWAAVGSGAKRSALVVTPWASPCEVWPAGKGAGWDRGAWASSLVWVLGPGSGDMMGDRVPAGGGCGRSFYGGRPRRVRDDAPRGDRSIR